MLTALTWLGNILEIFHLVKFTLYLLNNTLHSSVPKAPGKQHSASISSSDHSRYPIEVGSYSILLL